MIRFDAKPLFVILTLIAIAATAFATPAIAREDDLRETRTLREAIPLEPGGGPHFRIENINGDIRARRSR